VWLDSFVPSRQGTRRMKTYKRSKPLDLPWEEISLIGEGLSQASRPLKLATQKITDEYSLGPRGAWMLRLISKGKVYPLDLSKAFNIGRSLITAELNRLADANLINYTKSISDGRRLELRLTPLGERVSQRVKRDLSKLITHRLSGYTREQVALCARMLLDFRLPDMELRPAPRSTHEPRDIKSRRKLVKKPSKKV
jgi:DNA-binding MarR family transcriptional regulator